LRRRSKAPEPALRAQGDAGSSNPAAREWSADAASDSACTKSIAASRVLFHRSFIAKVKGLFSFRRRLRDQHAFPSGAPAILLINALKPAAP
jgi:hypothetical protein